MKARLEITTRCNLACMHCSTAEYRTPQEWTTEEALRVFDDMVHNGIEKVDFLGGEPFIRKDILQLFSYLDKRGIGIIVTTNGLLLDEDTIVLIMSDHGARPLDGGFCINEWLVQNGLLVLNERPTQVTPFAELDIDWSRTKAWSEGGYYGRVFLNIKGREPEGTIDPADYEAVRDDLKLQFEAVTDDNGQVMGTKVFKPDQIYKEVRNVAPDLLVHFGDLAWRAIGGVGYGTVHVQENDTGPDDCNHAQFGAFALASSNNPLQGEVHGAHLLDLAPTLLELAGYDVPASMQGSSLVRGKSPPPHTNSGLSSEAEEAVKRRLSGLGYIS